MSSLTFQKPAAPGQWLRLYKLYRTAFPASERKPFSMIVKMYRRGKTDLWCISRDGVFVGLAATINGEDLILLDYFAVEQNIRGQGVGSEALRALQKIYSGKGLFVEIESPYDDSPNRAERQRRKQFYLSNGLTPLNVMVLLFGVRMELLGVNCWIDYPGYHAFYRDNYSPWAAEHISEEPHPGHTF